MPTEYDDVHVDFYRRLRPAHAFIIRDYRDEYAVHQVLGRFGFIENCPKTEPGAFECVDVPKVER